MIGCWCLVVGSFGWKPITNNQTPKLPTTNNEQPDNQTTRPQYKKNTKQPDNKTTRQQNYKPKINKTK